MKKEVVSGAPFLSTSRGFCHPWIRQSAKDRRVGESAANIHVVEFEKVCRLQRSGDAHFEESDRGVCTAAMVVKARTRLQLARASERREDQIWFNSVGASEPIESQDALVLKHLHHDADHLFSPFM